MITLDIPQANRTLYLPEDLSECDSDQYKEVCELIYQYNTGEIIYNTFRVQAFSKLLYIIPGKNQLTETEDLEKNSNISQHSELIDSFFETPEKESDSKVIKQNYTNNHIPFVYPLWHKYFGPSDQFNNITFGEYTDAINLYIEYETTKDEEYLRLLMAIFYRKKRKFHWLRNWLFKYTADVRESYNEATIEARANTFKELTNGELYGFYLFLASFHKYLTNCELNLNGNPINIGMLFQESETKEVSSDLPGLGLKSIEYQLSESGVFGSNKEVRATNLWEILIRLYDITKRDKDEAARQEAAERKAKSKTS